MIMMMPRQPTLKHGLDEAELAQLKQLLRPFAGRIERVCLFGSRAQGTHKPYSDVDLVLMGPLTQVDVNALHSVFLESALPFKVDVLAYALITQAALKAHVDAVALCLFEGADLLG
jgi:predicted nucleotidyltransferase